MKRYEVNSFQVTLLSGLVKLTPAQADARAHAISDTKKKNVYQIHLPIHFKRGEQFEYDGEIPKALAAELNVVEKADNSDKAEQPAEAATTAPEGDAQ